MTNELTVVTGLNLLPEGANENTRSRVIPFLEWLNKNGQSWLMPDLAAYRDQLLIRLSASSANAHLSTIRGQYRRLTKSNELRQALFDQCHDEMTFVEKKAVVDEWLSRLENAIHPANSSAPEVSYQDYEPHVRLTKPQVQSLISLPGEETLTGIRDTALIRLLLGTGLREEEAIHLEVRDLYREYEGWPALEVRIGKGQKQRMVLYGAMERWVLDSVELWRNHAGIDEGPVFYGLWKDRSVREKSMNKRSVQFILAQYPIARMGKLYTVTPHDLRYTYARTAHDAGMSVEAIAKNMGHSSTKTTMRYIGDIAAHRRQPPAIYE